MGLWEPAGVTCEVLLGPHIFFCDKRFGVTCAVLLACPFFCDECHVL